MTRMAFFMPSLVGGGAERVTVDLCKGLASRGHEIDLVLAHADGPLATEILRGPPLNLVDMRRPRTLRALVPLVRYLRESKPDVLVAVLSHACLVATIARFLARSRARLILMQHNTMSVNTAESEFLRDRYAPIFYSLLFRRADVITAVSAGVADDFAKLTHIARRRITVLPNPIDYDRIRTLADQDCPSPIEAVAGETLLVAAGRLVPQKDFETLLEAVRFLGSGYRLILLGDGPEKDKLERLSGSLGISSRVQFQGFTSNPYPYYKAADVFVLSSRWEGLPTVLLEVLAFDTRIVATDCPSGPREILQGGDLGSLVPIGDARSLAKAIDLSADQPPPSQSVRERALTRFSAPEVCHRFEQVVSTASGAP